jgi:hypothetical protein
LHGFAGDGQGSTAENIKFGLKFADMFREKAQKKAPVPLGPPQALMGYTMLYPFGPGIRRGQAMFKERRKSERYNFNRYARIQVEMSGASRDCLIINMSDEGVRLHSEIAEMPSEFTLVVSDAEHPRRSCRVVWRLGFEIGAKFTDIDRLPVRRPATSAASA